jgi:rhodanese-related sulfurtransferase
MLYDTWQNELTKLPDSALILPAHGAGSLCGANLSDAASSTWGEQKVSNPYLQMKSRNEFIMKVIDGLPVAPQYFGHNAKMNHDGPPLVDWKAPLQKSLTPSKELMDDAKYQLVDVRSAEDYAKGHVPKSLNIGIRGRYETWTGIMIPWGSELVVVGSAKEYEEAVKRLHRIGYEAKFLDYTLWEKSGLPITSNQKITPEALYSQMNHNQAPMIVDVRLKKEWDAERIGAIVNMPVNQLQEEIKRLNTAEPVIAVCNSAYRSSMALGIFERAGFDKATSLDGGGEAWMDAGYPMYGGGEKCQLITEAPVETPAVFVKLADRISPSDLKKMQMDLPGTFDLVDIRPAAGFADWHLSEARHMAIAELLNDPTVLSGKSPLVIVDRDGSLAMMVAGILSQKTDRPVKALHGGLEKYWDASMSGNHSMGSAMGAVNSKKQLTKPTISKPQQVKPPVKNPAPAVKKRKRSAGC